MGANYNRMGKYLSGYSDDARRSVKRSTRRSRRQAASREIERMIAEDQLGELPDAMDVLHAEALRDNEEFDFLRNFPGNDDDDYGCDCCCCTGECRTEV